jgi:hypothetical protein
MDDCCCLRTVRILNIISIHIGERAGTNLLLICYVGLLVSRPDHSSNGQMTTLAHCYYDP